jgi:hypothetical protein
MGAMNEERIAAHLDDIDTYGPQEYEEWRLRQAAQDEAMADKWYAAEILGDAAADWTPESYPAVIEQG